MGLALRNQQGGKLANHIGSKELQASSLLMAGGFVPVVDLKGLNTGWESDALDGITTI